MFKFLAKLVLISCILLPTAHAEARSGEAHTWNHGDWTSRVLWEARRALSQSASGYSSNSAGSGQYQKWYADWNYVASDPWARDRAQAEGYYIMGPVTPTGGYYRGGECTYFVRLILFRSTYWAYWDHYAMHNYPNSVYGNVQVSATMTNQPNQFRPGWMLIRADPSSPHYAIAEKRATVGGKAGWWVIDSNWVAPHIIGKHFMSDDFLKQQKYHGTAPQKGTWNN